MFQDPHHEAMQRAIDTMKHQVEEARTALTEFIHLAHAHYGTNSSARRMAEREALAVFAALSKVYASGFGRRPDSGVVAEMEVALERIEVEHEQVELLRREEMAVGVGK